MILDAMIQYRFSQAPDVPHISHYYGDQMRQLFISAAALMLVGSPFYADSLRVELPFILIGALALVALAALANPHNKNVFYLAAGMSGAGVVIYGMWALNNYESATFLQFIIRLIIALVFMVGFYFNMKTLRAFVLGKVGKREEVGEFDFGEGTQSPKGRAWQREFMPWFFWSGKSNGGRPNNAKKTAPEDDAGTRMSPGRRPDEIKPKYHPYEDTM